MIFIPSIEHIEAWAKYNAIVAEWNARFPNERHKVLPIEHFFEFENHCKWILFCRTFRLTGYLMIEAE